MAKNVFFSEETMKGINQLVETEHGRTVTEFGKGNFVLGGVTAIAFGAVGYAVYKAVGLGSYVIKYLRQ